MKKHPAGWLGAILSSAVFASIPFINLLDPLDIKERLIPETHLEYRWGKTYDQPLAEREISFRWLGTTGFQIRKGDFVLLVDPYLTRVGFPQIYLGPLQPNTKLLEEKIPKADYIFITDSHFDHFLDTPLIALRTGAKVVGSPTTAKLLRLHGVPESQIIEVGGGEKIAAGPFQVKVGKAEHGRIWIFQPFHRDVDELAKPPLGVWDYGNLENRCYRFTTGDFSFFATSGADLDESELKDFRSDLVMANVTCLVPGYLKKLLRITGARTLLPTHYDNFFQPFSAGVQLFPITDLKLFCREIRKFSPKPSIVTLDFFQEFRWDLS